MSNEERQQNEPVIRLGISTCLLGERVRYDGAHKLDRFLVQTLGRYVEWVPVCPEVEMGLPVPRESMRLEGDPADPRLVASRSSTDHTEAMKAWAQCRVDELAGVGLHGFVLKKDSPSSGLFRVKVYNEHGMAERNGMGMFPRALKERFPLLPMEEEGRLNDMPLRENFIERVFAYQRWTQMLDEEPTPGGLVPAPRHVRPHPGPGAQEPHVILAGLLPVHRPAQGDGAQGLPRVRHRRGRVPPEQVLRAHNPGPGGHQEGARR